MFFIVNLERFVSYFYNYNKNLYNKIKFLKISVLFFLNYVRIIKNLINFF